MGEVLVEVTPDLGSGGQDLGGQRARLESFERRAGEISSSIATIAAALQQDMAQREADVPDSSWFSDKIEVTFGIDLKAETNVVVAKATGGTTFSVKITWSRERPAG